MADGPDIGIRRGEYAAGVRIRVLLALASETAAEFAGNSSSLTVTMVPIVMAATGDWFSMVKSSVAILPLPDGTEVTFA